MSDFLERISHFSPKRLALLADELNDRVASLEAARHEPIAIVGIGCRLPGGVDSPAAYWQLLRDGVDAVTEVPPERWPVDAFYDPDPDKPGKMSTRWGGWVGPVDGFDAGFFGISPREAQSMDPQQRLLLEVSWRALEDAGIAPPSLEGSRTGVFVGLSAGDYYQLLRTAGGQAGFDAYTASGTAHSIASGRLSYTLGLRGPSLSIDTACSSSLVAIHQAVMSLRRGECEMALAGGVNLILGPDITIALSRSHMMAPDGRCKAFDARADGFVRGEGCAMLVLKPLARALAAGDRVLAVIRGAAANQDGRSNGLTAPNGPAQEAVLRDALADAGLAPRDIGFVEAHGTGTSLGDPIEVQALHAVFGAGRTGGGDALRVGSVKAAIGHLEAAAGAAAVVKTVLVLRHGQIPGQLHLQQLNPYIPWERLAVEVPRALTDWPAAGAPRRAGVSSFGFSGTNVHLVLEEAPAPLPSTALAIERPLHVYTVSARSEAALAQRIEADAAALRSADAGLPDLAHAANAGRAHFAHRVAVVAANAAQAADRLAQAAPGEGVHRGQAGTRAPRVAMLFTGQGSQYAGMARSLYDVHPAFRADIDRCDELLRPLLPQPLLAVLHGSPAEKGASSAIDDTAFTQPALFAVEYSLARLWLSWGLNPQVLLGHSIGEIVAACVAGVFSLEDALKLVAARGRLMAALPRDGGMAAVAADETRVRPLLAKHIGALDIAALNGPANTVVSGRESALAALLAELQGQGITATRLQVSHAFHSPLMEPMLADFRAAIAGIRMQPPVIELISNLSGQRAGVEIATADYWVRHVREAVRFAPAMATLVDAGIDCFVEAGPHPVLLGLGAACAQGLGTPRWLPSLRRGRDEWATLLDSVAQLHVAGVAIDWAAFDAPWPRRAVAMPGYPFQRERYWIAGSNPAAVLAVAATAATAAEPGTARVAASAAPDALDAHSLLGAEVIHPLSAERLFVSQLHLSHQPWLADHRIQGNLVLPSPVCMAIAVAAAHRAFGQVDNLAGGEIVVEDLTVHRALPIDGETAVSVHTVIAPEAAGTAALQLLTRESAEGEAQARFEPLATAQLRRGVRAEAGTPTHLDLDAVRERTREAIDVAAYYGWLESLGLEFGPCFRGVQEIWRCEGEVLAAMRLPEALRGQDAGADFHPALLDACFHVVGAALPGAGAALPEAFLLMNVQRLAVRAPLGERLWAHVRVDPADRADLATRETFRADLHLHGDDGVLRLALTGIAFKRARAGAVRPQRLPERLQAMLHEVVWREVPGSERPTPALTPKQLAAAFEPELPAIAQQHRFERYAEFLPGLDRLASAYVRRALRALGLPMQPGDRLGPGSRAALGILERHQRLFERMLQIGTEDGWLQREGDAWRVVGHAPDTDVDPETLGVTLASAHPDATAELALTQRCARELAAVMRGRTDPLALLFPGGSLADTERLYRDSPPAKAYNGLIAQVVERIAAAWPTGRPLRMLEIGAGTGSTTAYVLPRLAELAASAAGRTLQYTFTDVSPLFLHRARERFAPQAGMRYQLLDIGLPPAAQGFESTSYDIVIGANVLHATADLQVTLDHVKALLAPGGHLVLLEGVLPQRFGDLTVGMLDGWWAYSDTHRRSYALMPRADWLRLLGERGFAEAAALPGETSHPVWKQQAVFVAQVAGTDAAAETAKHSASRWLIVPDRQGVADALAEALRARGDRADLLDVQTSPAEALAAALRDAAGAMPTGVLNLAPLDLDLPLGADVPDTATLMAAQQRVLGGALALVQALVLSARPLPLWLVTRGAQAVRSGESAEPAQATLWGLSHVVALEHPELACRRIDLDPQADAQDAVAALLAEIDAPGAEDQIALRGAAATGQTSVQPVYPPPAMRLVRLARRLRRAARAPAGLAPIALRADRSYLVTGGLHGLGLRVARWLAQRGVRHLVLMARRAPDAAALVEIAALRKLGAEVLVHQGDVADETAVAALLHCLREAPAPLAGVIHAAGALDDGVLSTQTWARFESVMAAKVRGSWNLHRHAGLLDFMVFFSSGASVGGSPGQANHAAANAFEDALAWQRNATGRTTLSINWGPWAEIGAAADRGLKQPGALKPIAPADGLMALEHLLRVDAEGRFQPAQMAVLATDWAHLAPQRAAGTEPPLYRDLALPQSQVSRMASATSSGAAAVGSSPTGVPATTAAAEPGWRERLAATLPNRRRAVLRELVRGLAARVLGLARADELAPDEPLRQLGLDSLMAVELRNLLSKAVGQTLPATVTFDHPSVAALMDHLARTAFAAELGSAATAAAPSALRVAAAEVPPAPLPDAPESAGALDDLDADALATRLMNRLDQLDPVEPVDTTEHKEAS